MHNCSLLINVWSLYCTRDIHSRDILPKNENSVIIYSIYFQTHKTHLQNTNEWICSSYSIKQLCVLRSVLKHSVSRIFFFLFMNILTHQSLVNGQSLRFHKKYPHVLKIKEILMGTTWGWVNDNRIFIFGWTLMLIRTTWKKKKIYIYIYILINVLIILQICIIGLYN